MHGMRVIGAASALAGAAALAEATQPAADGPPAEAPPAVTNLEIELLAGAWLPRLNGTTTLGSGAAAIDLESRLSLNAQEPTLNLELTIRKQEFWELMLGGFDFSTDASGLFPGGATFGSLVLNDGDPYEASFDIRSVSAEVAVALWRPYAEGAARAEGLDNRTADGRPLVDLRFSPVFGMRYLDVDQTLAVPGVGRERGGGEWLAVLVGIDIALEYRPEERLPWLHMFGLQAGLSAGPALGGDGGLVWQVRGGLTLQVTENVGALIGYRLVELDVERDDYSFDGGLQGLFVAGTLRF